MDVRVLSGEDLAAYAALRREMLADSPWAFAASPDDDVAVDPGRLAARLAEPWNVILGAFDAGPGGGPGAGGTLIGAAGVYRDRHAKMAHRARVWGVYVTPGARGRGVGARLMRAVLELARSWPGVDSVGLSVSERSVEARRLYERMGFRAWGMEPGALILDGRAYDEVHMVAFLDQAL